MKKSDLVEAINDIKGRSFPFSFGYVQGYVSVAIDRKWITGAQFEAIMEELWKNFQENQRNGKL